MEEILQVLQDLKRERLIENYAIGGAMAVIFYAEPIPTKDVDVFVFLPKHPGRLIVLTPIFEYLKEKGYGTSGQFAVIGGRQVDFIPAYNPLVEDAVREAIEMEYGKMKTKVIRPEYSIAISLQTGRPKDKERILLLLEEAEINHLLLEKILKEHRLWEKWKRLGYRKGIRENPPAYGVEEIWRAKRKRRMELARKPAKEKIETVDLLQKEVEKFRKIRTQKERKE